MSGSNAVFPSPRSNYTAQSPLEMQTNPEARRRRSVQVTEKRLSKDGGGINGPVDDNNTSDSLRHTIRGEQLLGRPRDLTEVRKDLLALSAAASRRKKSVSRAPKRKWQVVLSVFTKICLLLAALLWLGQLIWKWRDIIMYSRNAPMGILADEARLSEVETSLKNTARMLQVQLDVADKKIETEFGNTKDGLQKQLAEKGLLLEKELKRLETQTDDLGKSLAEVKGMEFLQKEEFHRFLSDLKDSRSLENREQVVSLDEVRNLAKQIVEKEIEKHSADGLGRIDYALSSGGGKVIRHSEPYLVGRSGSWLFVSKGQSRVHSNAQKMLEPSFGEPGQCFALQGNAGFVDIRLRTGIIPDAVTLEHVSKSVAYDRSSAPKECRVFGWFGGPNEDPPNLSEKMLLTEFIYDLEKSNAQTFDLLKTANSSVNSMVRLEFSSNHGSSTLTCIYRFRVHGHEPKL